MVTQKLRRKVLFACSLCIHLILMTSCEQFWDASNQALTASIKTPISEEDNLFNGIAEIDCIPNLSDYEVATLIDVIDGDSIKVIVDGKEMQVRYIGINTPEYDSSQRDEAIEATIANRKLLMGNKLYLFKDISNTDKYDRLLRYVVAGEKFINLELVQAGYAESKWYRPDTSCQEVFDSAVPNQ